LKHARMISLLALVAGAVLLAVGAACGSSSPKPTATAASPTDTQTPSATATPTTPPTPTATPTPFNGKVARFKYPRFGVDAPIEALSVLANNEMDTPHATNTAVGWYDSTIKPAGPFLGTKPGWDGNAVFSAHIYYINSAACPNNPMACPGPFQKIAQAATGDDVSVVMEDGTEYHYKVISKARYPDTTIDMGKVINPPDRPQGKQWLTMITCGGDFDASGVDYQDRDVIVAERVS
jgi:hypothetical protein